LTKQATPWFGTPFTTSGMAENIWPMFSYNDKNSASWYLAEKSGYTFYTKTLHEKSLAYTNH